MAAYVDLHVKFLWQYMFRVLHLSCSCKKALTTSRNLTRDAALIADCLYAHNWREA